jgi:hypothetical protein
VSIPYLETYYEWLGGNIRCHPNTIHKGNRSSKVKLYIFTPVYIYIHKYIYI